MTRDPGSLANEITEQLGGMLLNDALETVGRVMTGLVVLIPEEDRAEVMTQWLGTLSEAVRELESALEAVA